MSKQQTETMEALVHELMKHPVFYRQVEKKLEDRGVTDLLREHFSVPFEEAILSPVERMELRKQRELDRIKNLTPAQWLEELAWPDWGESEQEVDERKPVNWLKVTVVSLWALFVFLELLRIFAF